jgi:hypothetical protein
VHSNESDEIPYNLVIFFLLSLIFLIFLSSLFQFSSFNESRKNIKKNKKRKKENCNQAIEEQFIYAFNTLIMQPYQQSSSAIPQGPSTSSSSTRNSKLDQIIQVKRETLGTRRICLTRF